MTRWLETDTLSNQDISTALAVGAYTADADRLILVQVFADQVAGNGDYELYVTHQIAGAGSAYRMIPITTAAAASGVTAIAAQSGMVAVRSGDVLTVYLDGLAGDNSTPDTTVRWFELAALRPTTADRTLDVTATGAAGVDWSNIEGATTTVGLSGTTIKTATDVETDTADIQSRLPAALVSGRMDSNTGAMASDVLTAAALAQDAVAEIAAAVASETDDVLSAAHGAGAWGGGGAGSGAITFTYTLTSSVDDTPIAGADVWVTTDQAGTNIVASGVTDAFGQVVFYLDAGTYYVWRQLAGWTFANPDTEVVS